MESKADRLIDTVIEEALIGSVFLNADKGTEVVDAAIAHGVNGQTFTEETCRRLWAEAVRQCDKNGHPDALTIGDAALRSSAIEFVGRGTVPYRAEELEARLANMGKLREARALLGKWHEQAGTGDWTAEDLCALIGEDLYKIGNSGGCETRLPDLLAERAEHFAEAAKRGHGGLRCGIGWLDEATGGFDKGSVYVVSGGAGTGKTSLVREVLTRLAKAGHKVSLASLELSAGDVAAWMAATDAGLYFKELREGRDAGLAERFKAACVSFGKLPITITDEAMTPARFCSWARRQVSKGAELVAVDYLQLLQDDGRADSEERRVSAASQAVLRLAIRAAVPVLAIASESNAGTLRHSGQILYDAAVHVRLTKREDGGGVVATFPKLRYGAGASGGVGLHFHLGRLEEDTQAACREIAEGVAK